MLRGHGIAGECVVESLTDVEGRFSSLPAVRLQAADGRRLDIRVESARGDRRRPIVAFSGVDSRDRADELRGWSILVALSAAAPAPPGSYFYYQLIGCRCLLPDGTLLGTVSGIDGSAPAVLLEVAAAAIAGRSYTIPFAESICRRVDVAARVIEIDPPEGLLDL